MNGEDILVSYDVTALFTNVPLSETTVWHEIFAGSNFCHFFQGFAKIYSGVNILNLNWLRKNTVCLFQLVSFVQKQNGVQ